MEDQKNFSMDRFIDEYIDKVYKSETAENILISLATTALLSTVAGRFGRSALSMQSPFAKKDVKKLINAKLYWQFRVGFFSTFTNEAAEKRKKKKALENYFDALDFHKKVNVLNLSFDKPEVYLILADKIIADFCPDIKSA